ncbi:hypothetical protein [Amycolatopsis sp. YIM 10]|uniref:hypothetical protein n=1 Tax=Amycolatopsis sp. YIM 10 TaxID=2653857 RepID=UPI00128FE8D6|nr:hypothetical protein [Amycolatopsis sp. YIM 10]QFU88146.1 hypothetical protein YIM_14805 [Amycolatopsis sp. YIM 10]
MRNRTWAAAVGVVLVAGGCGAQEAPPPAAAPPPPPPQPTRELVTWADTMCQATDSLTRGQLEFEGLELDPAKPDEFADMHLYSYLSSADTGLENLASEFSGLPPSGVAAGDELAKGLGAGLQRILPEVKALVGDPVTSPRGDFGEMYERARKFNELLDSVKPPGPDYPALVAAEPQLAAAHHLAPRCQPPAPPPPPEAPPGPLPAAANGTDFGSCADGECQILVTGEPKVRVGDNEFTITLTEKSVTLKDYGAQGASSTMRTGMGGKASWGNANTGKKLEMTVTAVNAEGAVLDFKTVTQ